MTAATLAPAEEITSARKVYEAADVADWKGGRIATLLTDLWGAISTYEGIEAEQIHPAEAYDEVRGEDEALHMALGLAARDAGEWAREVLDALPGIAEDINDNGGTT